MEHELPNAYGWLIAGAVLLGLEAFGIPGIGFLFAGLAAICVGIAVHFDLVSADNLLLQAATFLAMTGVLAALLWRKLKSWRINPKSTDSFSNIIGDMATAGKSGLKKGVIGQVSWSGTTMMATLDPTVSMSQVAEGAMVTIVAVKGNQLIVAPVAQSE